MSGARLLQPKFEMVFDGALITVYHIVSTRNALDAPRGVFCPGCGSFIQVFQRETRGQSLNHDEVEDLTNDLHDLTCHPLVLRLPSGAHYTYLETSMACVVVARNVCKYS